MHELLDIILTHHAPAPIGPYSQAVKTGDFIFCSGQIALDPQTGEMVTSSLEDETHRVLKNLTAVLEHGGAGWANVVKTTIFLTDLKDFAEVNKLYELRLGTARPARSTVQVAALPKGARVEIECIARVS